MKKISILIVLLCSNFLLASEVTVYTVDELIPIFPDQVPASHDTACMIHGVRNSVAGFHLYITDLPEKERISISVQDSIFTAEMKLFKLIDVPVERNTGIESRTEKWDGETNPYVIRRAPFRIYEALQPLQSPFFCEQETIALRLQWFIPEYFKAGAYQFSIQIEGFTFKKNIPVQLTVHQAVIPPAAGSAFGYTNWFSVNEIAARHNVPLWSEPFWQMLEKYARLMAYGRQNMFLVPLGQMFTVKEDQPVLNEERLTRFVSLFQKAGLPHIEFSHFAFRTNHDWSSATLSSTLQPELLVNSEKGQVFYASVLQQLSRVIELSGWENRCRFHVADEPTDELAKDYKKFVKLLHKYFPEAKIMEATMTEKLKGVVDVWTPQLQEYQKKRTFFDRLKRKKASLWVYSCLIPGGKWLNRLLDQERLRMVFIGWSLPYFNLDGFLHWGLNHYHTANPFIQSVVDHPQAPNTNNQLPAGDTHLIYPGLDGPWSSTRLEAHRIGFEDAELFRLLQRKDRKLAKRLIEKCFKAFDDYETSVTLYRQVRLQLLQILDQRLKSE